MIWGLVKPVLAAVSIPDLGSNNFGLIPECPPAGCGCHEFFYGLIPNLFQFLIFISIPIAVVVILYGGFRLLTSAGNDKWIAMGKDAIFAAVVGLVIVFGSYLIYNLIINLILGNLPNVQNGQIC